jgi:peptidoglycan/LPS O-acetylase OafA/YrhL
MLPVTLLLATVSYLVVERPFMEMRVRYLDSSQVATAPQLP